MLLHPYFQDMKIKPVVEKREKNLSVKTNLQERRKRESSYDQFEDYYSKIMGNNQKKSFKPQNSKIEKKVEAFKLSDKKPSAILDNEMMEKTPPRKKNN